MAGVTLIGPFIAPFMIMSGYIGNYILLLTRLMCDRAHGYVADKHHLTMAIGHTAH